MHLRGELPVRFLPRRLDAVESAFSSFSVSFNGFTDPVDLDFLAVELARRVHLHRFEPRLREFQKLVRAFADASPARERKASDSFACASSRSARCCFRFSSVFDSDASAAARRLLSCSMLARAGLRHLRSQCVRLLAHLGGAALGRSLCRVQRTQLRFVRARNAGARDKPADGHTNGERDDSDEDGGSSHGFKRIARRTGVNESLSQCRFFSGRALLQRRCGRFDQRAKVARDRQRVDVAQFDPNAQRVLGMMLQPVD